MAAEMSDPTMDPTYTRRLDRSPEGRASNLSKVTESERRKIYSLRTVFGKKLDEIQDLEDTVVEK